MNAEFQRIARRDKKAFLRYQCKEIEENNRMGKTSDVFQKIRDTKGNLENLAVATGLEKVSFHSNPKVRQCQKCSNYCTIAFISQVGKVMLKILQARLQQYLKHELPDIQARFRKGRGTRDQIANMRWIIKKARKFQENVYFCFNNYAKAFDSVDHNKLWKILKSTRPPDLPLEKPICRSGSNS